MPSIPLAAAKGAAGWRTPLTLLILMSIAMPVAFNAWSALINNFAVERAAFTGVEIGVLQSLREVPGFMAFTTVFVLLILKEQTFAVLSFTINHIAAVVVPAALGLVWVVSHSAVFLVGVGFAVGSLVLARNVPDNPAPGNEVIRGRAFGAPKAA